MQYGDVEELSATLNEIFTAQSSTQATAGVQRVQPQLNGKYLTMANRETSIIRRKQLNGKLLSKRKERSKESLGGALIRLINNENY